MVDDFELTADTRRERCRQRRPLLLVLLMSLLVLIMVTVGLVQVKKHDRQQQNEQQPQVQSADLQLPADLPAEESWQLPQYVTLTVPLLPGPYDQLLPSWQLPWRRDGVMDAMASDSGHEPGGRQHE